IQALQKTALDHSHIGVKTLLHHGRQPQKTALDHSHIGVKTLLHHGRQPQKPLQLTPCVVSRSSGWSWLRAPPISRPSLA
ncbi:hypothetical protein U1872_22375, partial [Sphingomonas sp. RB3P16]|uniref:hypothetical protein n=1 Tax=Parasphingomonas frigoris TaxID=3096163 RepID=UPI002FC81B08